MHLRICCLYALKDEVTDLKKEAHDEVKIRLNLQFKIEQMSEEIAEFKKLVKDFPEFLVCFHIYVMNLVGVILFSLIVQFYQ